MWHVQGVYPDLSVYNRLMDWSASQRRLGDVVSLLSDMTRRAGLAPNCNTYRVLLNACQLTDQAALAFEVFAVMKLHRVTIDSEVSRRPAPDARRRSGSSAGTQLFAASPAARGAGGC